MKGRFVPMKTLKARSHVKAWFDYQCRQAYWDKHAACNIWSDSRFRLCGESYEEMKKKNCKQCLRRSWLSQYNAQLKEVLTGATQPRAGGWAALKSSLFCNESSIPPLVKADGSVTYQPLDKAYILADSFNSEQSREDIQVPASCHPLPSFNSFALRFSEIICFLSNLDEYGGTDPNSLFPLRLKRLSIKIAPKLGGRLHFLNWSARGLFLNAGARSGNITPIPKGLSSSPSPNDYRPISITPILYKIFHRLLAKLLSLYLTPYLPETQFGSRKGLGTSDALLLLVPELQSALDQNYASRLASLDFSAAFDTVNHKGLIFNM